MEEKFIYTQNTGGLNELTNNNLTCKDCKFVNKDDVFSCKIFIDMKPGVVLYGGKCKEKK